MIDLAPLRQDALAKVRRKYLQALFTDAALIGLSDFLDTLFRYPAGSGCWMLEALPLARTPLYYLSVPANDPEQHPRVTRLLVDYLSVPANDPKQHPRVTRLLVGEALYQGRTTQLYALPDWSPLLRGQAQPRPQGAVAGFFGVAGPVPAGLPAQLPLKGAA